MKTERIEKVAQLEALIGPLAARRRRRKVIRKKANFTDNEKFGELLAHFRAEHPAAQSTPDEAALVAAACGDHHR